MSENEPHPARLESVDILRGLVMVLMVLDHTRDFIGDVKLDPMDFEKTTLALFFTRWITHFCAPVFVLLAGVGAGISAGSGKSRRELAAGLFKRGLILILLEITVIRFGLTFDPTFAFVPLLVVWAIGLSMVVLAGLIRLPVWGVATFGLILILGHNAFDGYAPAPDTPWGIAWTILHRRGVIGKPFGRALFVLYPLIPWVGVMACGYGLGFVMKTRPERRRRMLVALGVVCCLGFVGLRWSNLYGDPKPWIELRGGFTALSFLNTEKYPPSLLYLLMTLGPAFLFLAAVDRGMGAVGRRLAALGREPLFYYVAQWYLIHLFAIGIALATGRPWRWLVGGGPFSAPPGYGYPLWFVYVMWILATLLLYAATVRYAGWNRSRIGRTR